MSEQTGYENLSLEERGLGCFSRSDDAPTEPLRPTRADRLYMLFAQFRCLNARYSDGEIAAMCERWLRENRGE